jgi:alkanesulfonate monooxygenase SsuD/methylene tetrahydromethanopterin reductase-like flavin-dependent oxidoreductase (luciferase family)
MKTRNTSGSQLSAIIGDPVAARETVSRFRDAGVDELILVMQVGTQPAELVLESIQTFGEKVLPYFDD